LSNPALISKASVPEKYDSEKWPWRQGETAILQALVRIYPQKLNCRAAVAQLSYDM
jgi:hypothetical protein